MTLTPREMLVMRLRSKGEPTKTVAARLGVTEQTVKNHLTSAYRKLGVPGFVEALNALGWVRTPDDAEYRAWLVRAEQARHVERVARIEAATSDRLRWAEAEERFLRPIGPDRDGMARIMSELKR